MGCRIEKIGNFSLTNHHGKNVYSPNGLSPCLISGIYKNGLNIIEFEDNRKCNVEHIKKPVVMRKFELTSSELLELNALLRSSKKSSGLSNKEISEV